MIVGPAANGDSVARKVFFSFHFARDSWRVGQVRNSHVLGGFEKTPFYDKADWEALKKKGDPAVQRWIDDQLKGTSVTVVLIGRETSTRRWVKYEIKQSIALGRGLLGIDITKIKDSNGLTDETGASPLPAGYPYYAWNNDNGRENLGAWIDDAAP